MLLLIMGLKSTKTTLNLEHSLLPGFFRNLPTPDTKRKYAQTRLCKKAVSLVSATKDG